MRRNELRNTTVTVSTRDTVTVSDKVTAQPAIKLTENEEQAFVKAMKIGYYKKIHKQGLITDKQLEMLIAIQNVPKKN